MKNYAHRLSVAYANFHQLQTEMCEDALELVANLSSYQEIYKEPNPDLEKAVNSLVDMIRYADKSPSSRITMLHMLANADFVIFPLSNLTLAATKELNFLYEMMIHAENCLEVQVA